MANQSIINTSVISTQGMGMAIDTMKTSSYTQRRRFERKWYDNNFFDDGYHFRYLSRTTGKIVDLTERSSVNVPQRAIPKASRQIRGVANLLLQPDFVPVIYPERITKTNYTDEQMYQQALELSKLHAQKIGSWITQEWKNQHLIEKLTMMCLMSAKQGISYLEIWPDSVDEKIKTAVFDAFEIYLRGEYNSIYDCPYIIKSVPELISRIRANEKFDEQARLQVIPDNKYASSDIKQAYMRSRFNTTFEVDEGTTAILNEGFIKEYLSEENAPQVAESIKDMSKFKTGDMVMRHVFTAAGKTLLDEYVDLPDYPFVDFRYEPGPIYQTPFMERFIPQNKTLDIVMSRIERYINTMVTGNYLVRKGENMEITNIPGGQKLEYTATPPQQMQIAPFPAGVFQFINAVERNIEEQGASTAALNQLPEGVKSGKAIESVKATEYANLKIPTTQLKETLRTICEKMMDIASKHFMNPQTVYILENGQPSYFDIIGETGIRARQEINAQSPDSIQMPDAIQIKGDYNVDIQIESGLGFTTEGRKDTMQQITAFMMPLIQQGLITQDAVKLIIDKFLQIYQFGSTQDLMEAMDSGTQTAPLNEQQITQMKVAILEALKEAGEVGPQADQQDILKSKIGVLEALKESGGINQQKDNQIARPPSESITFKDLPPEGQVQMAAQAGIHITPEHVVAKQVSDKVINSLGQSNKGTAKTN